MEENYSSQKAYDGLLRIGYVANLRGAAYLKELQEVLSGTEEDPTSQSIRERVNAAEIILINRSGYPQDAAGRKITERRAVYKAFDTGYKNANGEAVFGWFEFCMSQYMKCLSALMVIRINERSVGLTPCLKAFSTSEMKIIGAIWTLLSWMSVLKLTSTVFASLMRISFT